MSPSYYLFKSNNYIITTTIIDLLSLLWWLLLQLLFWLILLVQLFLRNQVGESSKQGIQAAWSTPIHHVKWWISRFRTYLKWWIISFLLFQLLLEFSSGAVYCSYEVSWQFGFVSFNFFIYLNLNLVFELSLLAIKDLLYFSHSLEFACHHCHIFLLSK